MTSTILIIYFSTALAIQIIFFLLEKYQKAAYDEIFKPYSDVNPHALVNIVSFLPIYNMYFLGVLIYSFLIWIIAIIRWIFRNNNNK